MTLDYNSKKITIKQLNNLNHFIIMKRFWISFSQYLLCYLFFYLDFVEKEHGVIENRPFKEAINGVFRSHAHSDRKKMKTTAVNNLNKTSNQADGSSILCTMDTERSGSLEYDNNEEEDEEEDEEDEEKEEEDNEF